MSDHVDKVRDWLSWVPPDHAKAAHADLDSLERLLDKALERLLRIEDELGATAMYGLPADVDEAIMTAWWDSRIEFADDYPLRLEMIAEHSEREPAA